MFRRCATALVAAAFMLSCGTAFAWRTVQIGSEIAVTNGNPTNPGTTVIKVGKSNDKGDVRNAEQLARQLNKAAEKGPKR